MSGVSKKASAAGNRRVFEEMPVFRAVLALALPTVVSQIITTFYNLADSFWVGRLNDPSQLAALALAFPVQMSITALSNLFGIGGGTVISRQLGAGKPERARTAGAFALWGALLTMAVYSLLMVVLRPGFLHLIGVTPELAAPVSTYLNWAVVLGGLPAMANLVLAHLIRGEGYARAASVGLSLGGIVNMVMDPFFVLPFGLGWGLKGAAVATLISNCLTTCYFLLLLYLRRQDTVLRLHPRGLRKLAGPERGLIRDVLLTGLPSSFQLLLNTVSNVVLNNLIIGYGEAAAAAMGLAKKIDSLPMGLMVGLPQGAVPLIAYNYGAGNRERMRDSLRAALKLSVAVAVGFTVLLELFAPEVVGLFINDALTVKYGAGFIRLHCLATVFMAFTLMLVGFFQAIGETKRAFFLSIIRKGIIDIPLMYLMDSLVPMYGIIACQPMTDLISAIVALLLYFNWRKKKARIF